MRIEQIVKDYRESHGMSQREFARKCGLSGTYIWYLESGKHPQTGRPIQPSLPALNKIAKGMGLTLDELMAKCDNMLVAISDEQDERDMFLALFSQLSDTQREAVLAVMKSFVS